MGDNWAGDSPNTISTYSGSIDTFKEARWNRTYCRTFKVGDLVTLSGEFRHSITMVEPDLGRYIGVIVQAYSNREYIVKWTRQPLVNSITEGMYNGDHLIKLEHANIAQYDK